MMIFTWRWVSSSLLNHPSFSCQGTDQPWMKSVLHNNSQNHHYNHKVLAAMAMGWRSRVTSMIIFTVPTFTSRDSQWREDRWLWRWQARVEVETPSSSMSTSSARSGAWVYSEIITIVTTTTVVIVIKSRKILCLLCSRWWPTKYLWVKIAVTMVKTTIFATLSKREDKDGEGGGGGGKTATAKLGFGTVYCYFDHGPSGLSLW